MTIGETNTGESNANTRKQCKYSEEQHIQRFNGPSRAPLKAPPEETEREPPLGQVRKVSQAGPTKLAKPGRFSQAGARFAN